MNSASEPKKSLGQHWLKDADSLEAMVRAAEVSERDTVLEIGPGLGTLTMFLILKANRVIAVEVDAVLAAQLGAIYDNLPAYRSRLEIIQADIRTFDFTELPLGYKVVANIPYYLTSNLLQILCESPNPFSKAALLVQKEVAERVAARPGGMSLLSISVQYYCEVTLGEVVPAKLFTPPPKVDSRILKLSYRPLPLFPGTDTKQFFSVVKAGFSGRRKTLENALAAGLRITKQEANKLIVTAGIDPGVRAQNLSLFEWHKLYLVVFEK